MQELRFFRETYSIPFHEVKRLLLTLNYGSGYKIAVLLLCLTGMRLSELSKIYLTSFYGNYIVWKLGKNQKHTRKEKLPQWFLDELDYFVHTKRKSNGLLLFGFNCNTLNRYINQKMRPILGGEWMTKIPSQKGSMRGTEYLYQLKGLRHNFQTLDFANNIEKWGKDVSIEFTSMRLKHSSYKMTARHYVKNFTPLNIQRYKHLTMSEIIKDSSQRKVTEYL